MPYIGRLWVTTHAKGTKMEGVESINTPCTDNPNCALLAQDKRNVCHRCYASRYMAYRPTMLPKLRENVEALTIRLLEQRELPYINKLYYRFESFGDLFNNIHLINYLQIAENNPATTFALWTKNLHILDEVFNKAGYKKPTNLIIVASSLRLNHAMELDREKYWMVDKVFTVYDKETIETENININCGGLKCLGCLKCYTHNDIFYINEKIK